MRPHVASSCVQSLIFFAYFEKEENWKELGDDQKEVLELEKTNLSQTVLSLVSLAGSALVGIFAYFEVAWGAKKELIAPAAAAPQQQIMGSVLGSRVAPPQMMMSGRGERS